MIYLRLAVLGLCCLSPVAVSGCYSLVVMRGFLIVTAFLLQGADSRGGGLQ